MDKVVERFIRYAKQCTTSDPESNSFPSTPGQIDFAKLLVGELKSIGVGEVELDKNGYVTGTIPANTPGDFPVVGFIAHLDTSPDFSGRGVTPRIIGNYNGGVLELDKGGKVVLDPAEFPEIANYIGQPLITAGGDTLLGADDKAGVAEIITAAEELLNTPEIKHGKIRICFTPDEEIGKGADRFDVQKFGADFAYTLDGGEIGELEFENFNAALAKITVNGRSVHPGAAKNKLVNAILVAHKIVALLPQEQRPEYTQGYEGFFHLLSFNGTVEKAVLKFLIRDHDADKFRVKKKVLAEIVRLIKIEYGKNKVHLDMQDQYYNMREKIEPVKYVVDLAYKAMEKAGVKPKVRAIRGGTDGARLSYMGLPCPNIFAGGHNFHGPYEFIPVKSMVKATEVIINICQLTIQLPKNA
ncbi:Tripeptide aminopeptidase [hydrothermal vent metagenome]|uniref:Tripeptide aminopeptidase n=1 Tax=hydrothermal vent metagenome TaxID=652676 RepID=A0A3B0U5F1_9ZZZZ